MIVIIISVYLSTEGKKQDRFHWCSCVLVLLYHLKVLKPCLLCSCNSFAEVHLQSIKILVLYQRDEKLIIFYYIILAVSPLTLYCSLTLKGWHLPLCVWSWVTVLTSGWDDLTQTLQHLGWIRPAHTGLSCSTLQILCCPKLYHVGPSGTALGQPSRYLLLSLCVDFMRKYMYSRQNGICM